MSGGFSPASWLSQVGQMPKAPYMPCLKKVDYRGTIVDLTIDGLNILEIEPNKTYLVSDREFKIPLAMTKDIRAGDKTCLGHRIIQTGSSLDSDKIFVLGPVQVREGGQIKWD